MQATVNLFPGYGAIPMTQYIFFFENVFAARTFKFGQAILSMFFKL
jgi:hypothetical protein